MAFIVKRPRHVHTFAYKKLVVSERRRSLSNALDMCILPPTRSSYCLKMAIIVSRPRHVHILAYGKLVASSEMVFIDKRHRHAHIFIRKTGLLTFLPSLMRYNTKINFQLHLHPIAWCQPPAGDFTCTNTWNSLLDYGRSPLQSLLFVLVERTQNIWTDMPRSDPLL